MEKLLDQDPMIAAYAFKILIRMGVEREEILPAAFDRQEEIGVHIHNRIRSQTLGEFISNFFGACDVKSVQRQDQRTRAWQDGPLRDYKLATEVRPGEDATKTGTD